jgi:hypothetical protein
MNGKPAEFRLAAGEQDQYFEWRHVGESAWNTHVILAAADVDGNTTRFFCDSGPDDEGPLTIVTMAGATNFVRKGGLWFRTEEATR